MNWLLSIAVFAYAGLSAVQWGNTSRWLYASPGVFWCGNVVGDPFAWLLNLVVPPATAAAVVLVRRCVKARRWSLHAVTALFTFVVASASLVYEARLLDGYGLEFGRVWWLFWR